MIYAETFTPPEQNSEYKRTIKAFKRNNGTGNEGDDESMDAGDQFGCRNSIKKAKKGITYQGNSVMPTRQQ